MIDDKFGYDDEGIIIKVTETQKNNMQQLEELILPLIQSLIDSSDKPKIIWHNRKEPLEKLKKDILKITRG